MGRPPAEVDLDKFIMDRGALHNLPTARAHHDEHVFRIEPAPTPVAAMLLMNLLRGAFFFGVHWLVKHRPAGEAPGRMVYGAPVGGALFLCTLFDVLGLLVFRHEQRRGPWLIYDRRTGRVELPREGATLERGQVLHLQYITPKRFDREGLAVGDPLSELNLVARRGGVRTRYPLLRSIFTHSAFNHVLKPLVRETALPVVRVVDQAWGRRVTETPYEA